MSSLSLASPWFINEKACQCALPLFAVVQNVRNNPSDTPVMLVVIDTTSRMRYNTNKVSCWHVNLYISSSYKSPLLRCHCSSLTSHIFLVFTLSPFCLFRYFPIPSEPVLLPTMFKMFLHIHSSWAIDSTIDQVTCANTIIYSDNSPWYKLLHYIY